MKQLRYVLFAALVFLMLQAACAPLVAPDLLSPASTEVPATLIPSPADQATATLEPIELGGPQMKVGSLFRYFDGALLDAVPNEGPFIMGHGGLDSPEHQVTVSDFWIYSVEVSNQMYARCVQAGKCSPPNAQDDPAFADPLFVNYPIVGVNWQQASDYCTYAHGRLPTEAEWEKAASWDPVQKVKHLYPWGDNKPVCNLLNFKNCLNRTTPVVQFAQGRSYYGVLNMEGNVFEWVGDWYKPNYYSASPAQDPLGPDAGAQRVIRSSAYSSDAYLADTSSRSSAQPSDHRNDLGFRCVVTDPTYFAPFCTMPILYGPAATTSNAGPLGNKPCPDPSLTVADYCTQGNTPVQNVTVNLTSPTIISVTGLERCNPANNDVGVAHQCPLGVTIHVNASCDVKPAGSPSCPPYYSEDPNNPKQCISSGGPGACPAGFQYDSSLQCCSAGSGANAVVPLCAAGQHYYSGMCVPDANGPQAPASITYTTSSGMTCSNGGQVCQLNQEICSQQQKTFDPAKCSCVGP